MTITSPCTGVCKLDAGTGWCVGCARTGDEIAQWGTIPAFARVAVWDALPDRFAQLGVSGRRLPWTTDETRDFVVKSLREARGTWVVGVVGAVAEFAAKPDTDVTVTTDGHTILAITDGGALRFKIDDQVRALTFDPPGTATHEQRIVLAVKRERGRLPNADRITDLGQDQDAIMPNEKLASLIDLGLGRKEARFCVRCEPGDALDAMTTVIGLDFANALPKMGAALVKASPTRVVESALGRLEVSTPIPMPGGKSPAGPHTHLLPDHLGSNRAMPAGMDLPRAYLPGAIFYPKA
ncbi:MAG: DUF1289 domain-containing protein [Pseudomonadota bacterium]